MFCVDVKDVERGYRIQRSKALESIPEDGLRGPPCVCIKIGLVWEKYVDCTVSEGIPRCIHPMQTDHGSIGRYWPGSIRYQRCCCGIFGERIKECVILTEALTDRETVLAMEPYVCVSECPE